MVTVVDAAADLAYEVDGAGTPVLFLHGLTFDRRTWRPIVEALDVEVRSICVDLPAHGESAGPPAPLPDVAEQLWALMAVLRIERPVIVGHSMSAGLALLMALAGPAAGVVLVDDGPYVQPFAELVHRLEPALRGGGFAEVWPIFERSLGLEALPDPVRALVLETHRVSQEVVLGYWAMLLATEPAALQAYIDGAVTRLDVPCLAVFGRELRAGERERFDRLPDVRLEEWVGEGHFVHLTDPRRFARRLGDFVAECAQRRPHDGAGLGG